MFLLGPQAIGTAAVYPIRIAGPNDAALVGLSSSDTLTAEFWAGDDSPAITSEAVVLLSATSGAATLSVPAADTVAIGVPGTYAVRVKVVSTAGVVREGWRGNLQLVASPGTAAAPRVYCSRADMAEAAGWVDRLQALAGGLAGFASQRAQARDWADEAILARVRAALTSHRRRFGSVPALPGVVGEVVVDVPGLDAEAGPFWLDVPGLAAPLELLLMPDGAGPGVATAPDGVDAQVAGLAAILDAGTPSAPTLLVDRRLRRACALMSIAVVCGQQLGDAAEGTSYQKLASEYRKAALVALAGCAFRIATGADGGVTLVVR